MAILPGVQFTLADQAPHSTCSHESLLYLLQLTDSAFPTGAFAHSFGLETYVSGGIVQTATELAEFTTNTLLHGIASSDGVACAAVYRAENAWAEVTRHLDHRLTALKMVSEMRQASRLMARRFLHTATQLFVLTRARHYLSTIEAKTLQGHMSLAYGLVCRDLALPLAPALVAWFRHYCASVVSAGVRLIPLGQTQGQVLLAQLGTSILRAVELALGRGIEDLASFTPGQELAGIRHRDGLTTRLYIS